MANLSVLSKEKYKNSFLRKFSIAIISILCVASTVFFMLAYIVGCSENDKKSSEFNETIQIVEEL